MSIHTTTDDQNLPLPIAPAKLIHRSELPEHEELARAGGYHLDWYHPVDGDDELVVVRMLETAQDLDLVKSGRYINIL